MSLLVKDQTMKNFASSSLYQIGCASYIGQMFFDPLPTKLVKFANVTLLLSATTIVPTVPLRQYTEPDPLLNLQFVL